MASHSADGSDRLPERASERAGPSEDAVRGALDEIIDPCSAANGTNFSVLDMGLLDGIEIDGRDVTVQMHLTSPECMMIPFFMREVDERVGGLDRVDSVDLVTDQGFEWTPSMMSESAKETRRDRMRARMEQYKGELTVDVEEES